MSTPQVAFLGLGTMGAGMARRLLAAKIPLTVYNRNRMKADVLGMVGARVADSPCEAAAGADVVISMVSDDIASRTMWLDDEGALAGAARGAVLVECSTLTVGWIRELAGMVAARGGEFVDAPVTGSKAQAAAGELNFLVGGSAGSLDKIKPVLTPMGKNIVHLGPTGSGALVKLINNFVCGVQVAALAEAMVLIERSGLDKTKALAVLTEGAPGSPLVKTLATRMTNSDFTPNFLLKLMVKDLGYALNEADARGTHSATAATALTLFQQALKAGLGDKDMAAVIDPIRRRRDLPAS